MVEIGEQPILWHIMKIFEASREGWINGGFYVLFVLNDKVIDFICDDDAVKCFCFFFIEGKT